MSDERGEPGTAGELAVEPPQREVTSGDRRLLAAAMAAPAAWLLQLGLGFSLVRWMCDLDSRWPLAALTFAALAGTAWGFAVCRRAARDGLGGEEVSTALAGARRALAWGGAGLAVFFAVLILATAVPGVFLEPCR